MADHENAPHPVYADQRACPHLHFVADVEVGRITDGEDGPVTHFTADVKINCGHCGVPFRFAGVPGGLSWSEPRTSVDGTELRAPIEPAADIRLRSMHYEVPPSGLAPVAAPPVVA